MRKILATMLLLCLTAVCALSEMEDTRAVIIARESLLDVPEAGASVQMVYYPGTRAQVLGEAENGYVPVRVGAEGGALTGYVQEAHIAVGEANIRQFRGLEVHYEYRGWTLYAQMDEASEVLLDNEETYLRALGEMDGWAHAQVDAGSTVITGFVPLPVETTRTTQYAYTLRTEPLPGEVTKEAAIEYAIQRLLADGVMANAQDGVLITREMLEDCDITVQALYDYELRQLSYTVSFWYKDLFYAPGHPYPCAFVDMIIEGEEIVEYGYGNG